MQALTVKPGDPGSLQVQQIDEPPLSDGPVLVDALAVGLCGTDSEIIREGYGEPPAGHEFLVLGHENLGRVREAPAGSGLSAGDLVVGIVRRPDPVPCAACAAGEWDMCRNGQYTEHGIMKRDGFARGQWRGAADAIVKIDPALGELGVLLEPTTILAKAWEQIERIGARAFFDPKVVAITGAGPVGLLGALLGVQRGLEVHVFDQVTDGPKPTLVRDLGATYHSESVPASGIEADLVVECTGVPSVVVDVLTHNAIDGIVCLTGVSSTGTSIPIDIGGLNRSEVLRNTVVFGSVNANKRHYDAGAQALAKADPAWLHRLISRRVPFADFAQAFRRQPDDVKVVLDLAAV